MIFGESVRPGESGEDARWVVEACRLHAGTVGGFVPDRYDAVARVHPPDPELEDWWEAYRELFEWLASVGARHTTTPDRAWFAIWEGHGFTNFSSHIAWRDPPADAAERARRAAEREQLRLADAQRKTSISEGLGEVPRFELADRFRAYYLMWGPLRAVSELEDPAAEQWRHPDLWWPDDRAWFVATDVDFWSLFVGGTDAFVDDLLTGGPTTCERVTRTDPLPVPDH